MQDKVITLFSTIFVLVRCLSFMLTACHVPPLRPRLLGSIKLQPEHQYSAQLTLSQKRHALLNGFVAASAIHPDLPLADC